MIIQFIFSEDTVKALCPISENIAGGYLRSAMFEAQEIRLKSILGGPLLAALKAHEAARDWDAFPAYAELKEQCAPLLAYQTSANLVNKVAVKIANAGAVATSDQNVANVSREEKDALIEDYTAAADYFAMELQRWICCDTRRFPELTAAQCCQMQSNLDSAASCGIWLGGPHA